MPKIKQAPTQTTSGCMISGVIKKPDGSPSREKVIFTPTHGGIYAGNFISAAPVVVIPDAEGRISVTLPPSAIMGPYSVRLNRETMQINVPDRDSADLHELLA